MTPNHAAQLMFRDADLDGDDHVTFDEVRAAAKRAAVKRLPSRVDVVVHSCRGLADFTRPKKKGLCCSSATLEEHTFCTVSVYGEPVSCSRLKAHTHSPRFEHTATVAEEAATDLRGDVVSVELWHRRKGQSPTPLGRCDVDVLAEQLGAEPISGAAYQAHSEWHRVAATDGFGDVAGQILIELRFYPPRDTPKQRGGHHASLMSPTTLARHEAQGARQFDKLWPCYRESGGRGVCAGFWRGRRRALGRRGRRPERRLRLCVLLPGHQLVRLVSPRGERRRTHQTGHARRSPAEARFSTMAGPRPARGPPGRGPGRVPPLYYKGVAGRRHVPRFARRTH